VKPTSDKRRGGPTARRPTGSGPRGRWSYYRRVNMPRLRISRTLRRIGTIAISSLIALDAGASRVVSFQDFVLARADALPEGSVAADTITFICDQQQWRAAMGEIAPPAWIVDPPGMVLLVGPLNHEFSCANVELRPKSDSNVVTLRSPRDSAPIARGGCAIVVTRTVRGEPIIVTGGWMGVREHQLASIQSCGERIEVPHTDKAEFLRVRLIARTAMTSQPMNLSDSRLYLNLNGMSTPHTAIAGRDGVAILQGVPASSGYEFIVRPPGCGEFRFGNQTVIAGQESKLEFDLGALASLVVRVSENKGGRRVPLQGAGVGGHINGEHTDYIRAETDSSGRAVLACIPASSKLNLRVNYPYHLWEDLCGIEVGPGGRSIVDVLSRANPDPRKPPGGVPPVCGEAR